MTILTPDVLQHIRNCAKDEESYHQLTQLFEHHNARLRESLLQKEAQYRAVVEQQIELVCRYLPDTTLTFVNEAYCRFFNKTPEELIGHSLLPLLDEDKRQSVWQRIQEYVTNPQIEVGENTNRRHDGELRWMQWVRRPVLNHHNEVIEIQSVGRDITDLKNAQEALNRSEQRYRRLIEASPDGIMITRDAQVLYANPALVRLLGGEGPEDLQGKTVFDLLHPKYHDLIHERIETLGHDHEEASHRLEQYVRLDGRVLDVEIAITPIELDGQPASVTFVRDVSRFKQSEEALHGFQDQLRSLHRLSASLANAHSMDEFCRRAVEEGRAKLGFDRLGLWFLNEARTHIVGSYGTDPTGQTSDERGATYPLDENFAGTFFDANHYLAYRDGVDLVDDKGVVLGKGWNALTALWNGDEVIGFLSADNLLNGRPSSPNELEILILYGSTLGHLATRIRAEEALRASEEAEREFQQQLRALHEVSIELTGTPSFVALCQRAVELGRTRLGFDRMSLWFLDEHNSMQMQGSFGTDEHGQLRSEWQDRLSIEEADDAITRPILEGLRPAIINDDAPLFDDHRQMVGRGWVAGAGLRDGSRIIGCLYVDNFLNQKPPGRYLLEILKLYGSTLGHLATRKWAEEALRHSEQRYRAVFEGAGTGICVVDARGLPVSFNPVFQQMLGYEAEELYRTPFLQFTHPADRDKNSTLFQELIEGQRKHYQYEKRYICKDGSIIWVRISVSPFPGTDPDDKQVIALVENINEQKIAESKWQESEIRNRALLDAMPDLIFLSNTQGVFLDYHAPAEDQLLIEPQYFLNRHYADVLPAAVVAVTQPRLEALIATGQIQIFEYELTVGGEIKTYESRLIPYGSERVLSIVRDVTERKRAEQQLRESEERFRQIADNVDEVFFIRDMVNPRILYINPAYEKLWQRPREEIYTNPGSFIEVVVEEDRHKLSITFDRESYPDKLEAEYRIRRADGELRWMWTRYFPIRDEEGRVYRVVGIVKDVTERKQMEQSSFELSLQRERIRIIADFIRDASHQFRTPLSIINSKLYLVGKLNDPQARAVQLQGIQEQSDNILKLVESLVAMSRLDSDAILSALPINVNEMLRAIQARQQSTIAEKGIQLQVELTEPLPPIKGDIEQLYNACVHLLENALCYTPQGGYITIRSYRVATSQLAIDIEDTGSGITALDLPRIFDRFYRGEPAMSMPGFGLGLPLAKKIVERHGGHIEVKSQPGTGSTFTIVLPVLTVEPASLPQL